MTVSFVHGHARATGWVVAHVRRPTTAEGGQLPLLAVVPLPRDPEAQKPAEPGPAAAEQARNSVGARS
jgi:hypothetical protein